MRPFYMYKKYIPLLLLSLLIATFGYVVAHVPTETPTDQKTYFFKKPFEIVAIFYHAIERNELRAFDQILTKEMIVPVNVHYIYDLSSPLPQISIYSELKKPIPVPADPSCSVGGITAILDHEGHIISTSVHIFLCE